MHSVTFRLRFCVFLFRLYIRYVLPRVEACFVALPLLKRWDSTICRFPWQTKRPILKLFKRQVAV